MKNPVSRYGNVCALFVLGAAACGGEDVTCLDADGQPGICDTLGLDAAEGVAELSDTPQLHERLSQIEGDLGVGSRGAEVQAVHEYLTQYGYFPNPELGLSYPRWRPVVAEAPGDLEVYDGLMLEAVTQLQRNFGLPMTGVVDEATRALLRRDRCGVPESGPLDPSEKFKHTPLKLTDTTLTWRVVSVVGATNANFTPTISCSPQPSCGDSFRATNLRVAFQNAFATWERTTDVDFTNVTAGPVDIEIQFVPSIATGAMSAPIPGGPSPKIIRIDATEKWKTGTAAPPPGSWHDIETNALHEIGHLLGLDHSNVTGPSSEVLSDPHGATMIGVIVAPGMVDRDLHPDDDVAGSLLYEGFNALPTVTTAGQNFGPAQDIAVGRNWAWVVGGDAIQGGGFSIRQAPKIGSGHPNAWTAHLGGPIGARAVAIGPADRPWIINGGRTVMERNAAGDWLARGTMCASDIGVGGNTGNGTAWALGCNANANGDFRIYRWTGSIWEEPNAGARATKITVDGVGVPWVVNSVGDVWRRPTATGAWEFVSGTAVDIGAGPAATDINGNPISYVYVIASDSTIWAWNEQRETFVKGAGIADVVSVAADASPWVIGTDGNIWAQEN